MSPRLPRVGVVTIAPETPPIGERHVPLSGALTFRDLGGYPTTDGHTTRWRTVFRADPAKASVLDQVPAVFFAAEPAAMEL